MSQLMKDYKIVEATTSSVVENEVKKLIVAGWKPLGNLVVLSRSEPQAERQVLYIQAMILDSGFQ